MRRIRAVGWGIAIALLCGALIFFNQTKENAGADVPDDLSAVSEKATEAADIPEPLVGKEVGMLAPEVSVPLYGNRGQFSLSAYRGKTVILNFWATWCGPCCVELPYFDEIYRKYGDEVAVVAIHSDLVTDDVDEYLDKYDYLMPFALDEKGEAIKSFGGSMMLPHTIVIDKAGVITYNSVGSLNLEKLEALIEYAR